MNRNLDVVYAFQKWFDKHPESAQPPRSDLQVPLISEFMPMRWSYEALVYAQAKMNPLTSRQDRIQVEIAALAQLPNESDAQADRLYDLKELLALVSGLRGTSPADVEARLARIDAVIAGGVFDPGDLSGDAGDVTAEQLYVNQKITDLVSKAEMEQLDYRLDAGHTGHLNVFFGPVKEYFGIRASVLVFNSGVLLLFSLSGFVVLYYVLRHQLRLRAP
jgi:hypothetical protein